MRWRRSAEKATPARLPGHGPDGGCPGIKDGYWCDLEPGHRGQHRCFVARRWWR